MDAQEFVDALRRFVRDSSTRGTIEVIRKPPGRRVSGQDQERAKWYGSLSERERAFVDGAIASAAHDAVFGVLAVLDGVRTIDDDQGRFELFYVANGIRVHLNPRSSTSLHDLLDPP